MLACTLTYKVLFLNHCGYPNGAVVICLLLGNATRRRASTGSLLCVRTDSEEHHVQPKHKRQGTSTPTKLNSAKLSTISHRDSFEQMVSVLAQWKEKDGSTLDEEWADLQQVVYNTAKTYLGKPDRKHQDWFDPNDQELQTLMIRIDQAHQRMLQTRNTRSTTAAYKKMPTDSYKHAPVH